MNNKRLIALTISLILGVVPGLCVLSFADAESGTNTEAQQHFEKANELRKLEDYNAAVAEYNKGLNLSPDGKIARNAQYWIGQTYFEAGQFDAALTAFQKLLDEYPDSTIIPSTKQMIERIQEAKKVKSLHEAATKGDIAGAKWLISKGADVNARDKDDMTPLHHATEYGRKKVAELLIVKGADVNAKDRWIWTPLHYACWKNHKDMAELLISKGADLNAKGDEGTPLRVAVDNGHKDVVEFLIDKDSHLSSFHRAAFRGDLPKVETAIAEGTDINTRDEREWTPLFWAVSGDQPDVAAFLINRGADVNATDENVTMPLYYAALHGYMEVAQLLIAKGASVNAKAAGKFGQTSLHSASGFGHTAVVELLIAKGADVNAHQTTGHTSLQWAAENGHVDVVELLISKGADIEAVDNWGITPLHAAVRSNRPEAVKLLLKRGANIDRRANDEQTPLHHAVRGGHQDMVDLLLANDADPGPWHRLGLVELARAWAQKEMVKFLVDKGIEHSAVHVAAFLGDLDQVKSYLAAGGDINARDRSRFTLLVCAIFGGQTAQAEFLISKGADLNLRNGGAGTPALIRAIGSARQEIPRPEIVRMLLDKGADVTISSVFGVTALHLAAFRGSKCVETILAKGADVNAKTGVHPGVDPSDEGWTPLHWACRGFGAETKAVVEVLISHGADINAKTKKGETPMSQAKAEGHEQIVELLRKHGAKE